MKILWSEATRGAAEMQPLWRMLDEYFPRIARGGTAVVRRHLPRSGDYVRSLATEALNNAAIIDGTLAAEREGYDAVVLGCWADPLWELRAELEIPVVGIGEASLHVAAMLGARFAVVTVAPGVIPVIEQDLRRYGLEARAIARPVRSLSPPSDAEMLLESITDPHKRLIPELQSVARQCIDDGAEIIVVGCGWYGPILSLHGYNEVPGTGVPVVDASAVGIKLAEALVDLNRSIGLTKSSALYFRPSPLDALARARDALHGGD